MPPQTRFAHRAVLLTPTGDVLLMQVFDPSDGWKGWITPGGGREPGEQAAHTLARELLEEVGRGGFVVGPTLWRRRHRHTFNSKPVDSHETFHLVRTERFDIGGLADPSQPEAEFFLGFKWWSIGEMEVAADAIFVPRDLPRLLRQLMEEGPADEPFEVGI